MEAIKTRKTYDGQFKRDAAKLVVEGGRRALIFPLPST
jgi:hypothetical protein